MSLTLNNGMTIVLYPSSTRSQVSSVVNDANTISRQISILQNTVHPLVIIAGLVCTVAAGSIGAPFFFASLLSSIAVISALRNWTNKKIEDVENIRQFFQNCQPFKFANSQYAERVNGYENASNYYYKFEFETVKKLNI